MLIVLFGLLFLIFWLYGASLLSHSFTDLRQWDLSAFFGILLGFTLLSVSTGWLLSLILPLFGISHEATSKIALMAFSLLSVVPIIILLGLFYFGLSMIAIAIRNFVLGVQQHRPALRIGW